MTTKPTTIRILSLDASTSTTAYAIIDIDEATLSSPRLIHYDFFKPIKKGTVPFRLQSSQKIIQSIFVKYAPTYIAIEEISQYMPGKSTAATIIALAVYNRMICLEAINYNNLSPTLLYVLSIRHGLKLTSVLPTKEEMHALVEKILNIKLKVWQNKKGARAEENEDIADAIAVGLQFINKLKELRIDLSNPRIKPKKRKELQATYKEITGKEYDTTTGI